MNEKYLEEFIVSLRIEKNLSLNTIAAYKSDIEQFFSYNKKNVDEYTAKDIEDYLAILVDLSQEESTINRRLSSLKMFYKYLIKESIVNINIVSDVIRPKQRQKLPDYLTLAEIKQLLSFPLVNYYDYRNKAMLELAYATGVRVSELVNLKIKDIDFIEDYITVIGKGAKMRIIPIGNVCLKYLKIYLDEYRNCLVKKADNEYLFLNNHGKGMTRQGFFKILKNIALKQGITKEIQPHILRHTFATHLLDNNASLSVIKELLGHESIGTTGIYTHVSMRALKDNYLLYHPHSQK